MRRISGIALLTRAAASMGGATTAISATQHRLVQAAMLSTCSNSNPLWFTQRLGDRFGLSRPSTAAPCAGGHVCFSTNAAASLAQEPHAHEKFLSKDVELYQYEACPFCNKVRGKVSRIHSLRWNFATFTFQFGHCMIWESEFHLNWSSFGNYRSLLLDFAFDFMLFDCFRHWIFPVSQHSWITITFRTKLWRLTPLAKRRLIGPITRRCRSWKLTANRWLTLQVLGHFVISLPFCIFLMLDAVVINCI